MTQSNGDGLRKGTGGSFWRRATMTAGDQADGGDTWHISKKDFNEYLIELDEIILADRKQHELELLEDFAEYCHSRYTGCTMDEYSYDAEVLHMAEDYKKFKAERSSHDSIEQCRHQSS